MEVKDIKPPTAPAELIDHIVAAATKFLAAQSAEYEAHKHTEACRAEVRQFVKAFDESIDKFKLSIGVVVGGWPIRKDGVPPLVDTHGTL